MLLAFECLLQLAIVLHLLKVYIQVFKTPEVSRVYIGTFWDHPLHYDINRRLFQDEQHDLFTDLQGLPRNAALRKLNDLIKRARLAKVSQ